MVEVRTRKKLSPIRYEFSAGRGKKAESFSVEAVNVGTAKKMVAQLYLEKYPDVTEYPKFDVWSKLGDKAGVLGKVGGQA